MFFIPLFLAKSLRRCLNTEPSVLMFNVLPRATSKKRVKKCMIEKNQKIYALYHNYRKSTDLIFILLSLDLSSFENTVDPDQLASHEAS